MFAANSAHVWGLSQVLDFAAQNLGLKQLLALQQADTGNKGTANSEDMDYFSQIHAILAEILAENACLQIRDLAVNGHDLMALGIQGKAIGNCLNRLLDLVIDEQLPNEKETLLYEARKMRQIVV